MKLNLLQNKLFNRTLLDYLLTFAGSCVSVGVLQLAVYPCLAQTLGSEKYGTFLTAIAIINAIIPTFGSTLRNAHIVLYAEYQEAGCSFDDFKRILLCVAPMISLLTAILLIILFQINILWSILVAFLLFSGIAKAYAIVVFRLPINPKKMFYVSALSGIGYIIGLPFLNIDGCWVIPFLLSETLGLLYTLKESWEFKHNSDLSPLLGKAKKTYTVLIASNVVSYCVTYIDRFLLYPLFGAAAVSTYYAASFIGKACTFFVAPFSTVLLSYISDGKVAVSFKKYNILNFGTMAFAFFSFLLIALVAPWLTSFLYPSLVESALPYIYVGNAASLLYVVNGVNLTIVLKVAPARWQLFISAIKLLVYAIVILLSFLFGDLYYFCLGMLFSGLFVFVFTYFVGAFYIFQNK